MKKGWLGRVPRKVKSCMHVLSGKGRTGFSQFGEDLILHYLFYKLGIEDPRYLDIGANDPIGGNNTYYFYLRGARGVCIEPDPYLFQKIRKARPGDTCLQIGIGLQKSASADFFLYPQAQSGWNTFSKEVAEARVAEGQPFKEVLQIPLEPVNTIIQKHFNGAPDLLSIDVEGLDFEILKTLDWAALGPKVLVAETVILGDTAGALKQQDMIDYVIAQGYTVYADTHINTIFVRKKPGAE